ERVTADELVVRAAGPVTLITDVASLDIVTSAAGDISITDVGAVTAKNVQAGDGAISITAAGALTATNVVSQTDDDANDIHLASTAGGVEIVHVDAGAQGDVTLNAASVFTAVGNLVKADAVTVTAA